MKTLGVLGFACVLVVSLNGVPATALDLPKLSGVEVRATATRDDRSGLFTYQYRLNYRGPGSLEVNGFSLDLRSDSSRQVLSAQGLVNSARVSPSTAQYVQALGPEGIVPAGFPVVPESWIVAIDPLGNAAWGAASESALLHVGSTFGPLTLVSPALPGLRRGSVEPELAQLIPNPDLPSTTPYSTRELFAAVHASAEVVTTIGPVAPPKVFEPLSFVEQIRDLVRQSHTLGWIRSRPVEDALDSQLDRLEVDVKRDRARAALESGKAFLDVLEDASCKERECYDKVAVTNEANALLRFNMDYLLGQLQPAAGKSNGDDKDGDKAKHPLGESS
jgi:hypothetical protein